MNFPLRQQATRWKWSKAPI